MEASETTPQDRADAEALLTVIGEDEPCGENSCHCHCYGGEPHVADCECSYCTGHGPHVCGCDCPRDNDN
jgi:hypothetical protein